jgi:hypothetical protein
MALKDIAPVLAKDFVTLKIDEDRMVGGKDMLNRYSEHSGAVPWFVFLDGDGKVLITSDDPDIGNIGYPGSDAAEPQFRWMLQAVVKHITPAEIDALIKSAKEFRNAKLTDAAS